MTQQSDEPRWGERKAHRLLDHDLPRIDGPLKVTGRAKYTHDIRLPDMVYARLLLCPHPSAIVHEIDLDRARKMPGVAAAISLVEDGQETRYLGQPVAVIAATTPELAEDALRAIYAEFEEIDWAVTAEQSEAEDAAVRITKGGNVTNKRTNGDRAEAEAAFEAAFEVVDATYTLPVQHHVCLETHGVVVDYRGGDEATVYISTQATSSIAGQAARELGLDASKVRILVDNMGGGFGSKFQLGLEGAVACRIAKQIQRPVHLMLTRPDEFVMAGNRSGGRQRVRAGAAEDGNLVAMISDIAKLGGVGPGSNPGLPYIYEVDVSYTESYSVHTNTDSNRAMRAPGHPQASFAMESVVDELAYLVGVDPLTFRKKNLSDNVYHRQLDRVAKEIGWDQHPNKTRPGSADLDGRVAVGIGFGVSVWGGGGRGGSKCDVRISEDGSVSAESGSQDLGTGVKTYMAAIVAEELGLPLSAVAGRVGDSRYPSSAASGGSVTTGSLAPCVKDAAFKARTEMARRLSSTLDCDANDIRFADGRVSVDGTDQSMSWREACSMLKGGLEVQGEWRRELAGNGVHGAQAAKVEVDLFTGAVRVVKMVCIQDQGLPLNTLTLRSQINGGMVQALSYGLLEQRVLDPDLGIMCNANLEDYKIAGVMEIPEMISIVDEEDDREAVIGMAEATVIPGHGAIANAIFNACGVRLRDLPLTADKVLEGLEKRRS